MDNITDIYKSLHISIGTIMKNIEILKLICDILKTKTKCKHPVKNWSYLLKYVPDQYQTQQIWFEAILENGGTLVFVSDCYKN